jgi:hypothetical protein
VTRLRTRRVKKKTGGRHWRAPLHRHPYVLVQIWFPPWQTIMIHNSKDNNKNTSYDNTNKDNKWTRATNQIGILLMIKMIVWTVMLNDNNNQGTQPCMSGKRTFSNTYTSLTLCLLFVATYRNSGNTSMALHTRLYRVSLYFACFPDKCTIFN